jgi:subtilase family serine protease
VRTILAALAILAVAAPSASAAHIGIAVAHPDPAGEDVLLARLFDRSSPDYHRFLTPGQYAQRFGVRPETQSALRAWLRGAGLEVDSVTGAGDYFLASGTATEVQALLGAIPKALPLLQVLDGSRRYTTQAIKATPNTGTISPDALRSIYEQPDGATGEGVSVAILGNGATDSAIADLHAFDEENGLPQLPVDVVRVPADGDFSDTSGNVEWNCCGRACGPT